MSGKTTAATGSTTCERGEDALFKLDEIAVELRFDQDAVLKRIDVMDHESGVVHVLQAPSGDNFNLIGFEYTAHIFVG